jgi:hypothetical protein
MRHLLAELPLIFFLVTKTNKLLLQFKVSARPIQCIFDHSLSEDGPITRFLSKPLPERPPVLVRDETPNKSTVYICDKCSNLEKGRTQDEHERLLRP